MKGSYTGIKTNEEGIVVCEKCEGNTATATMFADGLNFAVQNYRCDKCGATWVVRVDYEPGDDGYEEE